MANQVTNYKCPACTGPLHFVGSSGKLECDYCGSTYTVEEVEKLYAEKNEKAEEAMAAADAKEKAAKSEADSASAAGSGEQENEAGTGDSWEHTTEEWTGDDMKAYTCPSCGAQLMVDATTAATSCPYCGNTTIVPGQFGGVLKPEYIIPFKLDKEAAVSALNEHYKGKPFLPKAFKDSNHVEEIKGVYVPFWLYNGSAHAEGSYNAAKVHTTEIGDERITTTENYRVERAGDISFEKIPADASSKMPDDLMDSIEPYQYDGLKDFSLAYLAGYIADKYDEKAEDMAERAVGRAKKSALSAMKSSVKGYSRMETVRENVSVNEGKVSYAMMPVWLLNTKWNDGNYLFAMNGQTGKMVGDLPTDKKKFWLTFAGIALLFELLALLIVLCSGEMDTGLMVILFAVMPLAGAGIICAVLSSMMKSVAAATEANEYIIEGGMKFSRSDDRFINKEVQRVHIDRGGNAGRAGGPGPGRH